RLRRRRQQRDRDLRRVRRRSRRPADWCRGRRRGDRARPPRGTIRRRQRRRAAGDAHVRAAGRRWEHRADAFDFGGARLCGRRARARVAARARPRRVRARIRRGGARGVPDAGEAGRDPAGARIGARRRPRDGARARARAGGADSRQPVGAGRQGRSHGTEVSRLTAAFDRIRAERRAGLVTYTTAGDPDLPRSGDVLLTLDRAGADVLEVGVPFSDPLADGPVIQRATERALAAGASMRSTLDLIQTLRPRIAAPIVVFTYANPILRMGLDAFAARAAAAGVDGVLALDLPIEEAGGFRAAVADVGIDAIFLLSPTTTDARMRRAAELG